jgi:hypothetical protein
LSRPDADLSRRDKPGVVRWPPSDNCAGFLSPDEQLALGASPPPDGSLPPVYVDRVLKRFRAAYKTISFEFDWMSTRVSGEATKNGDIRTVWLPGGWVRQPSIRAEALAITLAHEVAHHLEKGLLTTEGLSCERWADYYATNEVMFAVYAGEAEDVCQSGIRQLAAHWKQEWPLTNVSVSPGPPTDCGYAKAKCRLATLACGLAGRALPNCG